MTQFPTSLDKLIELAKGTPYEHLANDEKALERMFLETLKASDDPMLREIGGGIADGSMTWHTVATHSAYAEVVEESLEKAREFDGGALVGGLDQERAKVAEEQQRTRERAEVEDAEDSFQGVLRRRR
ncbi:hypothetical protein [Actinophytocola sp.]|jgi:hypothetical protein|uniref:hypothetical protein n=1 Tax=Actinophytocola sp. TaxID=1872138 RepID=UPI002EDAECFC